MFRALLNQIEVHARFARLLPLGVVVARV